MTFTRHGNRSKAYLDSLRDITEADWKKLELACVEAVLNKQDDVILLLPYTFCWPKGMPKGVRIKEEGPVNYQKIKVSKLMKWLFEKGHTTLTMEQLRVEQIRLYRMSESLQAGVC